MDHDDVAIMLKALGDPTRLRVFEFLRSCACQVALDNSGSASPVAGLTVGEVCCSVMGIDRVTSTMSFHLKELRNAGLIEMERRGRHMVCSVNREALAKLAAYFGSLDGCCDGEQQL